MLHIICNIWNPRVLCTSVKILFVMLYRCEWEYRSVKRERDRVYTGPKNCITKTYRGMEMMVLLHVCTFYLWRDTPGLRWLTEGVVRTVWVQDWVLSCFYEWYECRTVHTFKKKCNSTDTLHITIETRRTNTRLVTKTTLFPARLEAEFAVERRCLFVRSRSKFRVQNSRTYSYVFIIPAE
jgi:hypothetical protein